MSRADTTKLTVRRRVARLNTIPAEQAVVEIMDGTRVVALMGSWTRLCMPKFSVIATQATDEQILAAYTGDESVFAKSFEPITRYPELKGG